MITNIAITVIMILCIAFIYELGYEHGAKDARMK